LAYKYGRTIKGPLMVMTIAYFVMFIWSIIYATDPKKTYSSQPYLGEEINPAPEVMASYFSVEQAIGMCTGQFSGCMDNKPAGGHLLWNSSDESGFLGGPLASGLYLFGLLFGLLCMDPKLWGWILVGFAILLILYTKSMHTGAEFSSMWCLYSVLWAFMVLLLSYSTRTTFT